MYFNPPTPGNNPANPFYHPMNEEVKTIDKKKAKDIYDKLKKGSEVEVDFGNAITRGGKPITLKVTSGHRVVGASKVGRIILVDKENPRGMKYKLFDRNGSVSLAQSDMGTILRDMKIIKEGVEELDEKVKTAFDDFDTDTRVFLAKLKKFGYEKEYKKMIMNFNKHANSGDGFYFIDGGRQLGFEVHPVSDMMMGPKIKKLGDKQDLGGGKTATLIAIKEDVQLDEGSEIVFSFDNPMKAGAFASRIMRDKLASEVDRYVSGRKEMVQVIMHPNDYERNDIEKLAKQYKGQLREDVQLDENVQNQVKRMDKRAKEKLAKQLNDLDLSGYGDYEARIDNVHKFKTSDLKMAMQMLKMNEKEEMNEAVKTKVEKTSQGFQVMVFSPKVKKFIPQGSPHKTKAEAEKDAKMFEEVTRLKEPHRVQKKKQTRKAKPSMLPAYDARLLRQALVLGKNAFKAGKKREPIKDPNLVKLKGFATGKGKNEVMKQWLKGWDEMNLKDDVQIDETNFRFPQSGEDYGELTKSISGTGPSMSDLKKKSAEIRRKFAAAMRKHKGTKVGEVLDLLDKKGERKVYQDSDIKQISKYLTKHKDNVRKVANQMLTDLMMGDNYLANKRIPVKEDVQLDEERGTKIKVMVKGDENVYERMTRALMYARLPGYEGATFNKRKGLTTYAFDAKKHTSAVRKKFAKIIQTHNGEFDKSIEEGFASDAQRRAAFASGYEAKGKKKKNEEEEVEEGLRQAMSGPRETPAQKRKRQEKDNFDLYKKRQGRIAALRGDKSSRKLTPKQQRDYLRRVNLDQIRAMEEVEVNEEKGTYSSMNRRGIDKPLLAYIAALDDELKKMGMKYSDKKVDPVIVMKAYNANKSPKEAAKMFKK